MKCPNCGAEMNHHADKLIYGVGRPVEAASTFGVDEVLVELHACPRMRQCGIKAWGFGQLGKLKIRVP